MVKTLLRMVILVDVSDIFYFFCLGEGKGESVAPGRGGGRFFFSENPRRAGGFSHERGGGEGLGGCLRGILGGSLDIFFRGRNAHQVLIVGGGGGGGGRDSAALSAKKWAPLSESDAAWKRLRRDAGSQ